MDKISIIKEKLDLKQMAEQAGAVFNHSNRSHCPLHQGNNKTAFSVFDNNTAWKCWTGDCGGGDIIKFYQAWQKVDFNTALAKLSSKAGIPETTCPPQFAPTPKPKGSRYQTSLANFVKCSQDNLWSKQGQPIRRYLKKHRGWTDTSLITWRIGYNPTCLWRPGELWEHNKKHVYLSKGVVYPHIHQHTPFWLNIRRPCSGDALAKYITPVTNLPEVKFYGLPNTSRRLHGTHTHQNRDNLLLVEGEPDLITAWQAAHDIVDVATLGGATNRLSINDAIYLTKYKHIYIIYDPDKAGQAGLERLKQLAARIQPITPLPTGDITDYVLSGGDFKTYLLKHILANNYPISTPQDRWEAINRIAKGHLEVGLYQLRAIVNQYPPVTDYGQLSNEQLQAILAQMDMLKLAVNGKSK